MVLLCLVPPTAAQIPASFQIPILGYVFDSEIRAIRPIAGIIGNSRIGAALPLTLEIDKVAFLPDHRHAIVGSNDNLEVLVLDLQGTKSVPIAGAPSSLTEIRMSPDGSAAALYYSTDKKVLVVVGLPTSPAIQATIDVSFAESPLRRFAVSNNGSVALLHFSLPEQDSLYTWTVASGPRYLMAASRVSDMRFISDDAVILDSGNDQALLIRNVREQATPALIADSRDGLSDPIGIATSSRGEIYIGGSTGTILVLDSMGHILKAVHCGCAISTMTALANSAVLLTDRINQPLFVLDGSESDQILFIPALSTQAQGSVK
jgi:hypothetical protein